MIKNAARILGIITISVCLLLGIAPANTVNAESQPISVGAEYEVGDTIKYQNNPYYIWQDKSANFYQWITDDLQLSRISYYDGPFTQWSASFQYDAIWLPVYMADKNSNPAVAVRIKSGDGTQDNPYEFEIVHAYSVTVESAENGTVSADKEQARSGETVTLTVTPADHYALDTLTVAYGNGNTITPAQDASDPSKYSFDMPSDNVTVSAAFKEIRIVEFSKNCDGDVTGMPDAINVSANEEGKFICTEPDGKPERKGYEFSGWYTDSGLTVEFDFSSEVPQDMILYAKWVGNVAITFDPAGGTMNGSTSPVTAKYTPGDIVTIPEAPTRDGYEFRYWEGSQYDPGDEYTVTAEDHKFTAVWEEIGTPADDTDEDSNTSDSESSSSEKTSDSSKANKSSGVKTGDNSHIIGWLLLGAAAAAGVVFMFMRRRNSK